MRYYSILAINLNTMLVYKIDIPLPCTKKEALVYAEQKRIKEQLIPIVIAETKEFKNLDKLIKFNYKLLREQKGGV